MKGTLERLRQQREDEGKEGGFTLIELLIVVVILGILAAIVVFAVQNLSGQSAKAACGSDYKTVESAAELYKSQVGAYPGGTLNAGDSASPATSTSPVYSANAGINALLGTVSTGTGSVGPWLKNDPVNAGHYAVVMTPDGSGTESVLSAPTATTAIANGCAGVN